MSESQIILSVKDLHISFGGVNPVDAVKTLTFQLGKGKTLAIVGESGSGKSLTALALMGLLPNSAAMTGTIILHQKNTETRPEHILKGKDISMVFQEPMSSLNPVMSIGKQLKEAILVHNKITGNDAEQLALSWLEKVQLPEPHKIYKRYPHQLSGGQKQRVMIAMAMCNHPSVLIADEPTTALDVTVQQEIIKLMRYLQAEHGTAMIFITHDLSLAATIADEVLVMYKGEVVEYGSADEVLQNPTQPYTKALIACKPSAGKKGFVLPVVADYLKEEKSEKLVQNNTVVGSVIDQKSDPVIEVSNLSVSFAEQTSFTGKAIKIFRAVDDVSFAISKGEVLGLVGESGCGKSTISRAVMGLVPVTSGSIVLDGQDITRLQAAEWKKIRRKVQMIFQDPYSSLNPRMTIGDMLSEPLLVHNMVPRTQVKQEVLRLLDLVQLPEGSIERYPHQFSGGQRQRIGIARALSLKPELLICDESVSALDVSIQAQILNLLKELQHDFQLTYLFISHDLSVVHYFSDRVLVMYKGRIVESGTADEVTKHPKADYTRTLVSAMP